MRYAILLFLIWGLFFSGGKKSEYFEGYKITRHYYQSKRLNTDSLATYNSSGSFYYYNLKYYKGYHYNYQDTSIYIYSSDINQCIWHNKGNKTLQCMAYGERMGPVLRNAYKKEGTKEINGYTCNILVFEYDNHKTTYYYTDQHRLHPNLYKNHVAFYYRKRMKMTNGGMVVRAEIKYPRYTKIIETVELVEEPTDDSEFLLLWFQRCP